MGDLRFSRNNPVKVDGKISFDWNDSVSVKIKDNANSALKRYKRSADGASSELDGLQNEVSRVFDRLRGIDINMEFN